MAMAEEYTIIAPSNFMGGKAKWYPLEDLRARIPIHMLENPNGVLGFDPLRARYLADHFDHVYLDIDVELFRPLYLKDAPQADGPGVLVGNGVPADGLQAWETYLSLSPRFSRPADLMFASMPAQPPPVESFRHHYARGKYF